MIAWEGMDERERAVWSATVAAAYVHKIDADGHVSRDECLTRFEHATGMANNAVFAMREYLKDWPAFGGEKP